MMTREMVMELLAMAGADLDVYEYTDGSQISVTVEDFEGFDDDYNEIDRELDNAELVESIESQLAKSALSVFDDFYRCFEFDGFTVVWGYASFDI